MKFTLSTYSFPDQLIFLQSDSNFICCKFTLFFFFTFFLPLFLMPKVGALYGKTSENYMFAVYAHSFSHSFIHPTAI